MIRINPLGYQVIVEEWFTIIIALFLFILAGSATEYLESYFSLVFCINIFLGIYIIYKYVYITRISYSITEEQLRYEFGIFTKTKDFIELYRVVDYSEQRSFLQILLGLKTVSIYSGDRTHPRLDIIGIKNNIDIISIIRERVEINKKKRNIHEFTNMQ